MRFLHSTQGSTWPRHRSFEVENGEDGGDAVKESEEYKTCGDGNIAPIESNAIVEGDPSTQQSAKPEPDKAKIIDQGKLPINHIACHI